MIDRIFGKCCFFVETIAVLALVGEGAFMDSARGQEEPLRVRSSPAVRTLAPAYSTSETPIMNYSSEEPAWLAYVGDRGNSAESSWWPAFRIPGWKTASGKKSTSGWWSSPTSGSSYSRSNKTTMQKVSQTSRRWWNNTLEFLDPYAPPKERPAAPSSPPGFWGKWFGGGNSEPKFNSVPEWASQPMPK